MVKTKTCTITLLLALTVALVAASLASAQDGPVYNVDHEWVQVFINQDGTIDVTYNITVTITANTMRAFDVAQPNRDFTIGETVDQYGNNLNNYKYNPDVASVDFKTPLQVGDSIWFTITTNVANMIANDTTNQGNYRLIFPPQWDKNTQIHDVRVQIVLPPSVTANDIKFDPNHPWQNTMIIEGNLAVYWEIPTLQAGQQIPLAVSFPATALPNYKPTEQGFGGIDTLIIILGVIGGIAAIIIFIFIIIKLSKSTYTAPQVSIETLGIKRGLTAVEASYLLGLKPTQIVTEILYSLLQKRAVWAKETKPSLKLEVLSPYENKTGTTENPLRYYEIDFLHALKPGGTLDEEKLAKTVMTLRDTTEQKLEGFSRKDTIDYYRKIVNQAWTQVEQAGTPELASNAYDEQLLWLMLDPNQKTRTETVFRDRPFQPSPMWFWWWYGYTIYHPHPTYKPNIPAPAQSAKPPAIPGAEFANNIATALENTSNNIVTNIEKFANSIVPPPPKASHQPARKGSGCVCACAACACACACVSCACACAGGGGR
ncbi:MAG: DUF2207 domain-containing protein [Candidatus Bathyarchaeota archaeon]|nr:DUF2207 domain-containing protein [Candidatus Bathyarchaeota archaeon]